MNHLLHKFLSSTKITFLLLLLALIFIIAFMFNPSKKFSKYEITETTDFSCSGIEDFTFKYPVSTSWGVQSTLKKHSEDQFCFVVFNKKNNATGSKPAQFTVQKITSPRYPVHGSLPLEYPPKLTLKNPQNTPYQIYPSNKTDSFPDKPSTEVINYLTFYADDFAVEIKLDGMYSLGESFSADQFFKTVIESFKLTK